MLARWVGVFAEGSIHFDSIEGISPRFGLYQDPKLLEIESFELKMIDLPLFLWRKHEPDFLINDYMLKIAPVSHQFVSDLIVALTLNHHEQCLVRLQDASGDVAGVDFFFIAFLKGRLLSLFVDKKGDVKVLVDGVDGHGDEQVLFVEGGD